MASPFTPDEPDFVQRTRPDQSIFSRHAQHLYDNRYRGLIRLRPGSKAPHAANWNVWNDKPQTPAAIEHALATARYAPPLAGIGMCAGNDVAALDADLTDSAAMGRFVEIVASTIGLSPLMRIGRLPKRLWLYRNDDIPGLIRNPVGLPMEVYGGARPGVGQVVLSGIHPDTGRPYKWPQETPLSIPATQLPALTRGGLDALLDALRGDQTIMAHRAIRATAPRGAGLGTGLMREAQAELRSGGIAGLSAWLEQTELGGRHHACTVAAAAVAGMGMLPADLDAALDLIGAAFLNSKPDAGDSSEWDRIEAWAQIKARGRPVRAALLARLGINTDQRSSAISKNGVGHVS